MVSKAKSSKISFLLNPYAGGSNTFTFIFPFTLFITKACRTGTSTSPIIHKALFFLMICSKTLWICLIDSIFESTIISRGLSNSQTPFSLSFIKLGFNNPLSYSTPSNISTSVCPSEEGSIITTPVSPTALKASPINVPNSGSLFVDILAIWSIISPDTGIATFSK